MCARRVTHPAAASFEPGASARFATSANSTRSVLGSPLRPASSRVITVSIPSRRHNASSTRVHGWRLHRLPDRAVLPASGGPPVIVDAFFRA